MPLPANGRRPHNQGPHVAGIDDLLDAVAEHILDGLRMPDPTGDVRTDLHAIAHAFRDRALGHPEAAALVLTRQSSSFEGRPRRGSAGRVAPGRQLSRRVGTLLREVTGGPTFGTSDLSGIADGQAALGSSHLERVNEAASQLARFDAAAEYAFTVDLAVEAVVRRLPQPPRRR